MDSKRSMRRGGRSQESRRLSTQPHLTDKHSLRLPAGGGAVVHKLGEPMATGRFDVAFHDDGAVVAGQQWSIELTFQGALRFVARARCPWVVGGEPGGRVAERSGRATSGPDARLAPILAPVWPRRRPRLPSTARSWRMARGRMARWSRSGWPSSPSATPLPRRAWRATSTTCN